MAANQCVCDKLDGLTPFWGTDCCKMLWITTAY